jgi:hypothetical protein
MLAAGPSTVISPDAGLAAATSERSPVVLPIWRVKRTSGVDARHQPHHPTHAAAHGSV